MLVALCAVLISIGKENVQYPEALRADSTHSYDVLHYLIDLDLPMTSRYLSGCVTMAARSTENSLDRVDLYLLGLSVDSVKVNGLTATYTHAGETLWIDLPQPLNQGDSFAVMVGYGGTASGSMGYLWYASYRTISYTLGCPFAEKRWFPCYDKLWDKADYGVEYYITVPDSFTVCATGEYLGRTVNAGYATYHWRHEYPISAYLIHFASSIYQHYSEWFHPATGDSIEIMYYYWPQDSTHAVNAFSLTTDMMAFFDSLFGPYPFERYGMDIVYPFYYGGMEHQTMATILRSWITSNPPEYYGLAHEMSHMWWGDMVTCFGWQNVWLNEGFAMYADVLYQEHREGHASFLGEMTARKNQYFAAENSYPHSIYDPPPDLIFAYGHTYCKGCWLLHMIRYLCNTDSAWLNVLSHYRSLFAYGNASTDDLCNVMNSELGGDYTWFFDEYVYAMGYPCYGVTWGKVYEAPNWRLILDVDQTQTLGPEVFHIPLPVGVDFPTGDTVVVLAINDAPQHFEFVFENEPMDVVVDPDMWILQKNTVTGVQECAPGATGVLCLPTVCRRAYDVKFDARKAVRIYDICGRHVFSEDTDHLHFQPGASGIYWFVIDGARTKVVFVR